jgi:nucleotide-binding universal stress UspA family protein
LQDQFSDLIPSVKVHQKVEFGKAEEMISEEARKQGVDMIVISTRRRSPLAHILRPSLTEKLVRDVSCPVLTIHAEVTEKRKLDVLRLITSRAHRPVDRALLQSIPQ